MEAQWTGKEGSYQPKFGEVAGFELFARLQDDGTLMTEAGTVFTEFPSRVEVCGAVYTLENVKVNELTLGRGDPTIRWGEYV